nr:hypothetical protein [uncultured Carboxylicivirga sp.]
MGNLNIIERDYSIEETTFLDEPQTDETIASCISGEDKVGIPLIKIIAAGAVLISSNQANSEVKENVIVSNQKEDNIELCITDYTNSIESSETDYLAELQYFNAIPNFSKQDIYKKVFSFRTLENNWDGYGAYPLEADSAANALLLYDAIGETKFGKVEEIYPNTNGTITFTWENQYDETINVEVGNKTMSYFVELAGIETTFVNNVEINDKEAKKLSDFIELL